MVLHIHGKEEFQKEIVEFEGVVVMDCYADRCGPCKMLGPIMEELAEDNAEKTVKIIKVDVDDASNQPIAAELQVSGIPAVFIFKNWEVVDNVVGANPKDVYQEKIDALLAGE